MFGFVLSALTIALLIFALADVITRQDGQIRNLNKVLWIVLIVIMPVVGSVLWFLVGREWDRRPVEAITLGDPRRSEAVPRRSSTEDELAALEREIEADEKAARIRRLEAELRAKRQDGASAG